MQSDLTLDEMLKTVFSSLADEEALKPKRKGTPISDPALWRALKNQDKTLSSSSSFRAHIPFTDNAIGQS